MEFTDIERVAFSKAGKISAQSRFKGMSKEQVSQQMKDLRAKRVAKEKQA